MTYVLRLRSHCTIFHKRFKARAEIRHTDQGRIQTEVEGGQLGEGGAKDTVKS